MKKNLKISIKKLQNDTSLSLSISELVSRNMERCKVCCITAVNGAGIFIYSCLQTICQKRYKCKQINKDIYYIYVHQRGFCLHIIIGQLRLHTTGQTLLYWFPNASVFKPQQNLSGVQQKLLSGSCRSLFVVRTNFNTAIISITADELFFLWRLLKYVKQQKLRGE